MTDRNDSPTPGRTTPATAELRAWSTPEIMTSDAFTRAALACCEVYIDGLPSGEFQQSQGVGLPAC